MVNLDALMLSAPSLNPALADPNPVPGGAWKSLLAAWIRLPGGQVAAQSQPVDTWPFAKDANRNLAEQFTITVPNVQNPTVTIAPASGSPVTIPIPRSLGKFRVHIVPSSTERCRLPYPRSAIRSRWMK